ncbi:MAG: ATPase, T2SS/T4P/T4SS family [Acidobacteria bacterium]|nr:ATPase, T2SS/T4P/T4SS family [Acidobacteriota bacterium]
MNDAELDSRLAELLVGYGTISPVLLDRAREIQRTRETTLGRALLEVRVITPETLSRLLEEITGARAVDPSLMTIYPDFVDRMNTLIPADVAEGLLIFPIQTEINTVHVCVLNPTDATTLAAIEALSGCHVAPKVAHELALTTAIETHYRSRLGHPPRRATEEGRKALIDACYTGRLEEPFQQLIDPAIALINRQRDAVMRGGKALEDLIREPAVIRLVHQMICRAVQANASDIHVEPQAGKLRVRARLDGALRTLWTLPESASLPVVSRLKAMADLPIEPATTPLDGRISYDLIWGRQVDFRFSLVPSATGERVVLRALERSRARRSLDQLGFQPTVYTRVKEAAELPNGILLVTGPTGSGKTTTLYALLDTLNSEDVCVLTAEDPVESRIDGTGQVPCDEARGVSFASALRSFLRQDPDVIMVGEIRDVETADIALKAALTGHLVLSTLHTNDAPGAIIRLINMNLEPFVVASALRLILAQRLIRRLCPDCKTPDDRPAAALEALGPGGPALAGATIFKPAGCTKCLQTGYRGRIAIHEALKMTPAIEELVLTRGSASAVRQAARESGMRTLRESALLLVGDGITSIDEAVENTVAEDKA